MDRALKRSSGYTPLPAPLPAKTDGTCLCLAAFQVVEGGRSESVRSSFGLPAACLLLVAYWDGCIENE
jgi:hypothetical protein